VAARKLTRRARLSRSRRSPPKAPTAAAHPKLTIDRIAAFINEEAGADLVTFSGPPIPIAPAIDDSAIKRAIGSLPSTPFQDGIRATMQRFAELYEMGRLDPSDL